MSQPKKSNNSKIALIIGAGPAGLTAAYELLEKTDYIPYVVEQTDGVGGLARTHNYKNNLIDTGGHRFFSKSDRVMEWWNKILPIDPSAAKNSSLDLSYQGKKKSFHLSETVKDPDKVMLIRKRVSHILHNKRFFDYPVSLSARTLANLGVKETMSVGLSYIKSALFPIRNEKSLEDFFINRFGRKLYETFFRDYTEKVWGVPCSEISSEWGAQRIKGLSGWSAIRNALGGLVSHRNGLEQKKVETSLIQWFIYPKYGAGQMWEEVSSRVIEKGGQLLFNKQVKQFDYDKNKILSVQIEDKKTGEVITKSADLFFSTMPVRTLIQNINPEVPENVKKVANGLQYRDFITVGVLVKELDGEAISKLKRKNIEDTWIYVHEKEIKMGRVQIFNNWSPYMVAEKGYIWLGLEYFCDEGDQFWNQSNEELSRLAARELVQLGFVNQASIRDTTVIRVPKAYPSYFGSYVDFSVIRDYLNSIENLFLLGRNGMHRYNNQDHSMLTAMKAVENVKNGKKDKENIWAVNTEDAYNEEK